jgi:UDP-perosamine 4-acetyltransferase
MTQKIILLGNGGHASVLLAMMQRLEMAVSGIVSPDLAAGETWSGIPVLGGDNFLTANLAKDYILVNGVGSLPNDKRIRQRVFVHFDNLGFRFQTLVDQAADRIGRVELEAGVQLLPGSIVQTGTRIARNTIVNTGAIIDHDGLIGAHVHIAPGAVLSGGVVVKDNVHIGTGACVIQGITIGTGAVIGAGAVVTQDVEAGQTLYPARSVIRTK